MSSAQFNEGTKLHKCFQILSDHKWHCGKHELPGTQSAALIRQIVQEGYKVQKETHFCRTCDEKTTHRKLV